MNHLWQTDPEVAEAIFKEAQRQSGKLELIASENFVSEAVLEAQGSVMTNKYAEGYPGKRYYGGCEYMDIVENLAIERAKKLFGADHVNVQPHSGTQANMAVYFTALSYGDTILGMNLAHGGHLSHGSPANFSGQFYRVIPYGVSRENETIDYDELRALALEHHPKMIVAGASAYPRVLDFEKFSEIANESGALLMVDMAHIAGLIAAGLHPSPIPHADFITTTTHKTLRGPRGGVILCREKYAKALNKSVFPGSQGGPLMHVIAAKAVAFGEALKEEFKAYQQSIISNARTLAASLDAKGYRIVSGGTDTHLMLVDLTGKGITGKEAQLALDEAGITVNKNSIPFETLSPFITSGIRLGTPALTTRGMKGPEMERIADLIHTVLSNMGDNVVYDGVRDEVQKLCRKFPLYVEKQVRP